MEKQNKLPLTPGEKVGRWTLTDKTQLTTRGETKRLCICDCGTERYVLERALRSGGSTSCGCARKENAAKALSEDLQGKVFGELSVLKKADHQRKNGGVWWTCRCSCGSLTDYPATLLRTGKRTHCSGPAHEKPRPFSDISGKRFHRLTALYPTEQRDPGGNVLWHCRCDCGTELDISYNRLVYTNLRSCGCRKREHDQNLSQLLTHVAGTSVDMLKSKKVPKDNTTGCRGVYLIRGKYTAKIVFQKKPYYLGTYDSIEDAAQARREAEEQLFDASADFYSRWKLRAEKDPQWGQENPVRIYVHQDASKRLQVSFLPALN